MENLQLKKKIETSDVGILLTLTRFAFSKKGKRNPCMKTPAQLAEMLGKSERTIRRALKRLGDASLIITVYRTKKMGEDIKITRNKNKAMHRVQNGAKQLTCFLRINI